MPGAAAAGAAGGAHGQALGGGGGAVAGGATGGGNGAGAGAGAAPREGGAGGGGMYMQHATQGGAGQRGAMADGMPYPAAADLLSAVGNKGGCKTDINVQLRTVYHATYSRLEIHPRLHAMLSSESWCVREYNMMNGILLGGWPRNYVLHPVTRKV